MSGGKSLYPRESALDCGCPDTSVGCDGSCDPVTITKAREAADALHERLTTTPDVDVTFDGSLFLFHLRTQAARDWVGDNVLTPSYFGGALVVEHRYAQDLAIAMQSTGMIVRSRR
jgi:hypothetical protein